MPLQPPFNDAGACLCKRCSGEMRLARVDPYPMPRGRIEIVILECSGCGSTLQQVKATPDQD